MKVFACSDFEGRWPVPVAAIVVALTENAAKLMLSNHLKRIGLPGEVGQVVEIETDKPSVNVLSDGDY